MDKSKLLSEYNDKKIQFEQLIKIVRYEISQAIHRAKIKVHLITHRIKPFDSFIDKIERKQAENPFWDIKDVVGFRVICYFRREVNKVGKIIEDLFDIIEIDDKIEGGDEKIFGYMALHYKLKLKDKDQEGNYSQIKSVPFEVQIRTIAQDAWASISHYLDYKKDSDIPKHLRRDFNALSGLFYVADTHFELVSESQLEYVKNKLENE